MSNNIVVKASSPAKERDVRDEIVSHMKEEGRTLSWLCGKLDINYNTLYACLVKKSFKITDDTLQGINTVLKTDFKK